LPCVAIYVCIEPLLLATNQPPHIAKGSALSQSLGFMTEAVSLLAYIIFSKMYRKTWNGILGEKELAVQTILNNVESIVFVMGINGGIVRGVGKQKIGAVVCCVCMYLIGGPAGLCLMFLTPLGVSGTLLRFWWGLSIGSFAQSVTYTIICARIDWTKECERAAKRTTIKFIGDTDELEVKSIDSPRAYDRREGSFSPDKVDYEYKEDENSQEEEEEPVKRCPSRVLLTRSVFISIMVLMLAVSICCRLVLDWSDYFPSYCLLSNFSLLPIPKRSERLMNPEAFKWLKRDCLDILPSQ
uniref:Multidrug and toxin extrusion protein 1 n=1 Tax=Schistocephalus solidus TaxID=70667 RepID=A0A183TDI0_SCHSO